MARRRKTLPKDFDALLKTGDVEALKAVFATCRLDAHAGYTKQTALAFPVPDELARWLVCEGLDVEAADSYGRTPLWERASSGRDFAVLVELGADINAADRYGNTPLHAAAQHACAVNPECPDLVAAALGTVRRLIEAGADVNAKNDMSQTPLLRALSMCRGMGIPAMAQVAEILLASGAAADNAADEVERIGQDFEFMKPSFSSDPQTDEGLRRLYELFQVTPVAARQRHDGVSPISVSAAPWPEQHQELWELLVPSHGHAATVQGEVVRITGRLSREILGNAGGSWDADFRRMANALASHLTSGNPVVDKDEAKRLLSMLLDDDGTSVNRLCELAVAWVQANPDPVALPEPGYRR